MTGPKVKEEYEKLKQEWDEAFTPEIFMLNTKLMNVFDKIEDLRKQCPHEFEDGKCIYCKMEEEYQ